MSVIDEAILRARVEHVLALCRRISRLGPSPVPTPGLDPARVAEAELARQIIRMLEGT